MFSCIPPAIPAHHESSCLGEQRDRNKQAMLTVCSCQKYQHLHHTARLETQTDNNTFDHWFATSFNLLNILPSSDQHEMPKWKGRRGKKRGQRVNVSVAFGTGCLQITVWSSRADLQAKARKALQHVIYETGGLQKDVSSDMNVPLGWILLDCTSSIIRKHDHRLGCFEACGVQ